VSAGSEQVTAAAITDPDPETALTSGATRFLMTRQFICTPAQAVGGRGFRFYTPHSLPPHTPVILRFSGMAIAPASP
jgi:hypothetical protein